MPGARMNTPGNGPPGQPADVELAPRTSRAAGRRRCAAPVTSTAPNDCWSGAAVDHLAGEQDQARARAEHREPVGERDRPSGARTPDESSSLLIVVDSPPGRISASSAPRSLGRAHLDRLDAERVEHLTMLAERPLQREDADLQAWRPHDRLPAAVGELDVEGVDLLAAHRLAETASTPWPRWSASV